MKKPATIHHVALKVNDILRAIDFFENVFDMSVIKTCDEGGNLTSVWLDGGVQLVSEQHGTSMGSMMDHISFLVENVDKTIQIAEQYGAVPVPGKATGWFQISDGIIFELKTE